MSKSLKIDFVHRYLWYSKDTRGTKKPYTCLSLIGKSGAAYPIWATVDTGADRVQLDARFGINAGYVVFNKNNIVRLKVANGRRAKFYKVPNVKIEVEGEEFEQDVLFGRGIPNLLGRRGMFAAIDFGLDDEGWLFKYL